MSDKKNTAIYTIVDDKQVQVLYPKGDHKTYKQLPKNHPHYHEIRQLLIKQVNDDLHDHEAYSSTNRRAS